MRRLPGRYGQSTTPFVPILFTLLCAVFAGIGGHLVWHATQVSAALAHDPSCSRELPLTAPASDGGACRVVRGTIVRAYKAERSTKHGFVFDRHFVFAPAAGPSVDFEVADASDDDDDVYDKTHRAPGGPAVVEYVEGEIDYVTDEFGTLGPNFDADEAALAGWFFVALGVFFAVMASIVAIINRRTNEHRRARAARIADYVAGGRPDVSPRAVRLARSDATRRR